MKKRGRGRWPLQKNDLPPERVLAREPRLRALESNPVFRLLLFRHRGAETPALIISLAILTIIPVAVFGGFGGLGPHLVSLMWIYFIYLACANDLATRARQIKGAICAIPREHMTDLIAAGYPASDFVFGFWGSSVTGRVIRNRNLVLLHVVAMILIFSLIFWANPNRILGVLAALLPALAYLVVLQRFVPYISLPAWLNLVQSHRTQLEARVRPLRAIKRRLLAFLRLMILTLLIFGFLFALGILAAWMLDRRIAWQGFNLTRNEVLIAANLLGMILGASLGWARGSYLRRHADVYLTKLTESMNEIINLWRERAELEK